MAENEESSSQRVDAYLRARVVKLMTERSSVVEELESTRASLESISAQDDEVRGSGDKDRLIGYHQMLEKRHVVINDEVETLDLINQMLRGKINYVVPD